MSSPVMVSSGPLGRLQGRWQPSGTTSRPSEASRNGLVYVDDEMEVLDEEEEEEDDEYLEDEEDDEEQALADEDEELDDDSSTFTSSPSIPDENIDFTLVYTLHTFEATVEGQASVLKGDSLTLLDDSNSYWWLVKVLKTNEVGYIPAENIETPFERLARLNKHRNVEVTSMQQAAHYISEASNAQGKKPKKAKNVTMSKMNAFQSYIILIGENDDDIEERYEEYEDEMVDEDSQSTVLASDDPSDNAEMGHDDADEDPEDEEFLQGVPASPIAADEHQVQALDIVSSSSPSSADATNASDILSTISSTSSSADHVPQTNVQPTSSNRTPTPQQNAATSPNASKKHPFLKIFSRKQKDGRKPQQGIMSPGPGQASLHSNVSLDRPENQLQSPSQPQSQPQARPTMKLDASATVLRVYAGNINVNATYNSVLVNDVTNAEQLLHLAMDRFHISQIEGKTRNAESARRSSSSHAPGSGVEYYLTVKSLDGEELTLLPQDKPLSMYQSLTAHLTTPMPSLASLKEQVTKVEHSRIGSPLHHAHGRRSGLRFNEDSVRFYLHKRIRRMNEREGQIYVKVSLYQEDPSTHSTSSKKRSTSGSSANLADNKSGKKSVASKTSSSPKRNNTSFAVRRTKSTSGSSSNKLPKNKPGPSQIDKLIAVSTLTTVAELLDIALEKFHLLQQAEHQAHPPPRYRITLSLGQQGAEKHLNPNSKLIEALHDDTHAKLATEKRFVLRKLPPSSRTGRTTSNNMNRGVVLQAAPSKKVTGAGASASLSRSASMSSPLLTPIPVMHLDTDLEMVLRRLERALLTYDRKQGTTSPVPRVHLDPKQPKVAVMRNVNQGIDVYLPHGILRSKPLAPHQTQYALLANNKDKDAWDLVTQRVLVSADATTATTSAIGLDAREQAALLAPTRGMVELVADADLKQMITFATAFLDKTEQMQMATGYSATRTTELLPQENAVETSLSSLDELERELQRIIASHTSS